MTASPQTPDAMARLRDLCADGAHRDAVLAAAHAAAAALIGHDLFTVMRFHADSWEVERLYSNMPASYPVGGRKAKRHTPWGRHVLADGKHFAGSGREAIEWAFDDAGKILDLGLEHVLNMPAVSGRRVVGTVNLLRTTTSFDAEDIRLTRMLTAIIAPFAIESNCSR